MKILFFGDSITDALRDREHDFWLGSYGCGYVRDIAVRLMESDNAIAIYNRGISGDKVTDLHLRFEQDVLNVEPDLLSILVGVNDVWHEVKHQNGTPIDIFENTYTKIIEQAMEKLPKTQIVLLEPFVLEGNATSEKFDQFLKVKEYAEVVKRLALKYGLPFIKLQTIFDKATENTPSYLYLSDGVHPTILGAKLIADEWWKWYIKK